MGIERTVDYESFPRQGTLLGRKVHVCFKYDPSHLLVGRVVRHDTEEPFRTIIRLPDGRHVLATECMHTGPIPGTE